VRDAHRDAGADREPNPDVHRGRVVRDAHSHPVTDPDLTRELRAMDVKVRPLEERDLPEADRIFRLAFGTFMGLPDPMRFAGDSDWIATRWRARPDAVFAADADGTLVGSNFVTRWGSVGFFGPLTVRPDYWDRGVARRLLEPTMELFTRWGVSHAGLFTFAQSPKHVVLYQRFGFWPRFLTTIMGKVVDPAAAAPDWSRYSHASRAEQAGVLAECRTVTDAVHPGLDLADEIAAVAAQRLGDTVLLRGGTELVGLAVCHRGAGSEAGSGTCYVKFGAVRPGADAGARFDRLLAACEAYAAAEGMAHLVAGMNLAREDAYRHMRGRGFRSEFQGVAMHRPNEPGYSRPDRHVIDDWR